MQPRLVSIFRAASHQQRFRKSVKTNYGHRFCFPGCTVDQPNVQLEDPTPAFMNIFYTLALTSYGHLLEDHIDELSDNGRFCLEHAKSVSGVELARSLRFVEELRAKLDDLMETYDLLMTPTMAVPAFPVGQLPERIGGQEVYPRGGYTPLYPPLQPLWTASG